MKYKFKQAILIPIDIAIIILGFLCAAVLRLDEIPVENIKTVWNTIFSWPALLIPVIYIVTYFFFDMYSFMLRHITLEDILKASVANVIAAVIANLYNFFVLKLFFDTEHYIPRSVVLIASVLILILSVASRCLPRIVHEISHSFETKNNATCNRILIYGAGFEGKTLAEDFKNGKARKDNVVVGFIDNNAQKVETKLMGLKVYSADEDINELVTKLKVNTILIAISNLSPEKKSNLVETLKGTGCMLKTLPSLSDFVEDAGVDVSKIRDVSIDDILHRKETHIDIEKISGYLTGETVMVTGAGGSIGSELCRRILHFKPARLVMFDIYENNIYDIEYELRHSFPGANIISYIGSVRDYDRIDAVMKKEKPVVVFHAAAHKHVPLMENSPGEAIKNNVFGTYNLAKAADANNVKTFVFISTDKAVNPTNVMGASKRMCEMVIQAMDKSSKTRFVAVRFGNVLGSNGSVVPLFKKQIAEMGPVTVTHPEITRFFMTIPEAARLVVQAGAMANGGEIFILDMGQPVKIADLAKDMIRLSGFVPEKDIKIVYTGLRPGEKLYEELMQSEEGTTKTSSDGIFIARIEERSMEEVENMLHEMQIALSGDDEEVVKALVKFVPTFHPEKAGEANKK